MLKLSRPQLLAVFTAIVLIVLLLLLPRKTDFIQANEAKTDEKKFSFETIHNNAYSQLSENNKRVIDNLKENLLHVDSDSTRAHLQDSIAGIWRTFNWPSIAAHYFEQSATIKNDVQSWFKAADAYFASFRFAEENKEYNISKAVLCYQNILNIDSVNLKAKTSIGVCFIEGAEYLGKTPMEGVVLLQEVIKSDPQNMDALFSLGYFAIQSAQYDKALERFQTILQIDSNYADAYIYIADIFLNKNDTASTVNALKKYKQLVTDETIREQVQNYITELTGK